MTASARIARRAPIRPMFPRHHGGIGAASSRPPSAPTIFANRDQRRPLSRPRSSREMTDWSMPDNARQMLLREAQAVPPTAHHPADRLEPLVEPARRGDPAERSQAIGRWCVGRSPVDASARSIRLTRGPSLARSSAPRGGSPLQNMHPTCMGLGTSAFAVQNRAYRRAGFGQRRGERASGAPRPQVVASLG